MASENLFAKTRENALTSEAFSEFISRYEIRDFYVAGADAVACVKSTCYNLRRAGYGVTFFSDGIAS